MEQDEAILHPASQGVNFITLVAHDFHIVALLAFIRHRDKLCTPTFHMLCYFVFCRNFCAPQCACVAVLRSPGGGGGGVTW